MIRPAGQYDDPPRPVIDEVRSTPQVSKTLVNVAGQPQEIPVPTKEHLVEFYSYELAGMDLYHDAALLRRVIEHGDLWQGMKVYCRGLVGDIWSITITKLNGDSWEGRSGRNTLCWGSFQRGRFAHTQGDDVDGWVMLGAGDREALLKADFA